MGKWISALFLGLLISTTPVFALNADHPGQITDDSALVAAINNHQRVFYLEAGNLTVTRILPDDTNGLPHQKWEARVSDGHTILVVYNSDMGPRVPVQVGDHFALGGEYIQTGKTGLMHWLHDDPKHNRPDGYVFLNGILYGDTVH